MRRSLLLFAALAALMLSVAGEALAAPQLTVRSPESRAIVTGSSVTVEFSVSDVSLTQPSVPWEQAGSQPRANRPDQGHLLLMLDLWPPVVWSSSEPYTFQNVPPGEHELKVELVNNDHTSLAPPVVQMVRFRTAAQMPPNLPNGGIMDVPFTPGAGPFALAGLALLAAGARLLRRAR